MRYWSKALTLVEGCQKVSEACRKCWLETIYNRFHKDFSQIVFREDRLKLLKIKKPQIFAVWSDFALLPLEIMNRCLEKMRYYKHHTFLICTKRPEKLLPLWSADGYFNKGESLENVIWGCTIENQKAVDERLPDFLKLQGKKFLSCEPLLGNIVIPPKLLKQINFVIAGCESGGKARETEGFWIDNLHDTCVQCNIPFWVKQIKESGVMAYSSFSSTISHEQLMRSLRG